MRMLVVLWVCFITAAVPTVDRKPVIVYVNKKPVLVSYEALPDARYDPFDTMPIHAKETDKVEVKDGFIDMSCEEMEGYHHVSELPTRR